VIPTGASNRRGPTTASNDVELDREYTISSHDGVVVWGTRRKGWYVISGGKTVAHYVDVDRPEAALWRYRRQRTEAEQAKEMR
jgi:hypothetical protein